jgi:hypothetical protein
MARLSFSRGLGDPASASCLASTRRRDKSLGSTTYASARSDVAAQEPAATGNAEQVLLQRVDGVCASVPPVPHVPSG